MNWNKVLGSLIGLHVGDSLGATLEFGPPSRTGCNKCKSIIEYYEPDDIKYIPKSIEATWRRYIECPSCDNHITVINTFDQMAFIYSLNTNLIKKDDN